jgi:hypothetical protein
MSKDVAARLDALTHDYREGRLSLTAYRNLRAPILDVLMSQPGVDGADQSTQRGRAARASGRSPSPDEQPARRGSRIMFGLVATMAILAAAVTIYLRANDVHISEPLGADSPRAQTLEESDDLSGARLHSMLADFDARAVCRKELAGSPAPFCRDLLVTADAGPELLVLAAGSGNTNGGARRLFAISVHEVSQKQFQRYCVHSAGRCGTQPRAQDDDSVVNVTWDEAQQYLHWLSEMSGQTYRLPTEAEWQQAADDGKKKPDWRVKRARVWTQDQQSPSTGGPNNKKDARSFRAVREL